MACIKILLIFILFMQSCHSYKKGKEDCACGHGFGHPWHTKLHCTLKTTGKLVSLCNAILVSPWHALTIGLCAIDYGKLFNKLFCSRVALIDSISSGRILPRKGRILHYGGRF